MASFKQGIIKTNKITVTPNTKLEDVVKIFKDDFVCKKHSVSDNIDIKIIGDVLINNQPFSIIFRFDKDGNIISLCMSPQINYEESLNHSERRNKHRSFCTEWLSRYFSDNNTSEHRQTVGAHYRSNYDFCDGSAHGYIWIDYSVQKSK